MKNQSYIWWVAGLLAGAVVLPTVCLLWFMGEAAGNVQLAMKQRLSDLYKYQAQTRINELDNFIESQKRQLEARGQNQKPMSLFKTSVLFEPSWQQPELNMALQSVLIYDSNASLLYPIVNAIDEPELPTGFGEAWQAEIIKKDFVKARKLYEQLGDTNDDYAWRLAHIGQMRCYAKNGPESSERERLYIEITRERLEKVTQASAKLIAHAHVYHWQEFVKEIDEKYNNGAVVRFLNSAADYDLIPIPADARIFLLQQSLKTDTRGYMPNYEATAKRLITAEQTGARMAETISKENFVRWADDSIHCTDANTFVLKCRGGEKIMLAAMSKYYMEKSFAEIKCALGDSVILRVKDENSRPIYGESESAATSVLRMAMGRFHQGWELEILSKDAGIFETAARGQTRIYVWAGVLVIACMFAVSGLGLNMLVRQARVNRLKNDFLATVSHELRTPLASMRLMLDTVLEGRYSGEGKAKEYLELASKENERLTRLIENFLSFSKMARNRKSFDIRQASAEEIAREAAEAVKNKYEQHGCDFEMTIARDVPGVMADKDAMVTVLVNLLDNACKYTGADKQIRLNVFYNDGGVYFQVVDNGIGMGRRAVRKIFEKFYQVDQSLARKAEGCGLGLSIVKFIVEAHKGKIEVESRSGKGSTFTVRLEKS
ncbi:MAG: hypothetical protein A2Y07_04470 [Planctomycetes bacterium GWF2_50_10]|nr:MAG: hypothetical protein A2Y07_04470 [Planctomycetes bacterium GWF2_50_10]